MTVNCIRGCEVLEPGNNVVLAETEPCVSSGDYNTSTQLCCGPLGREKILSKKHEENICCGDAQYNNGTHECLGDPPSVKERPVSPGTRSDRASIPRPAGLSPPHYRTWTWSSSVKSWFPNPLCLGYTQTHVLCYLWTSLVPSDNMDACVFSRLYKGCPNIFQRGSYLKNVNTSRAEWLSRHIFGYNPKVTYKLIAFHHFYLTICNSLQ